MDKPKLSVSYFGSVIQLVLKYLSCNNKVQLYDYFMSNKKK